MNLLSMLFLLALGGVAQAVLPPVPLLARAHVPVLAALVVYYALTRSPGFALGTAVLAGIVHDSLGLVPLGYSSFCFGVAVLLIHRFRADIFAWEGATHVVVGAAVAGGTTLGLSMLLRVTGQVELSLAQAGFKTLGSVLLGALVTPIVARGVTALDATLGLAREDSR